MIDGIVVMGTVGLTILLYIGISCGAVNNYEKIDVPLNKYLKCLLGFFFYAGNRFSIKSIILQSGNLIAFLSFCVILMVTRDIGLASKYQFNILIATGVITCIVALFVNRWK